MHNGGATNFHFGDYSPRGLKDGNSPVWPRGGAPVGGVGTKSPEAEAVCTHCLHIMTAETMKMLKISHDLPPDS